MITGTLLGMGYSIVIFFINQLPILPIPDGVLNGIALIWSYLDMFSFLIPLDALLGALTLTFGFHVAMLTYDLSLKVYHMIRG